MNDFVKKERECPDKYYGKIDYVFSKDGAFIFACALAGMGLFIFLRTIVSMFGFVRFEELYAAYSFIGYGSIATGLVNLFFGGLETLLLGSISVSIFSIIVAVKHENREKIDKYLKWIKKLLIFLWFFILIMFALTVTSAWLLDDAYRVIRKFNSSVEYNASWLLVSAGIYGFIAFTVQDIFINMVANLENTVNGKPSEREVKYWEIAVILVGGLFIAGELVLSIIDIINFNYNNVQEMPERFALLLINTVIYAIAVTVLMFFIKMFIDYIWFFEEDFDYFEDFYDEFEDFEETEKFESRVFKNEPVHFGRTEGYQLTFEIPHTEYPKESAGGVNE